jgi:glucokinase
MILAGDIGGTKTVLALYSKERGIDTGPLHETRYASADQPSLEAIIADFLAQTGAKPTAASFGVAGPVQGRRANITNLPWRIDADHIGDRFGIDQVFLLNDLQAIATAVPHLGEQDLHTLHPGQPVISGNRAVIAPGTGLGIASLVWDGERYLAQATEAGHTSFAARNSSQAALLVFLQQRYGHVSFERVCSGKYLPGIYDFLVASGDLSVPAWLDEQLTEADDRTPVIVQAAQQATQQKRPDICVATLDIFVQTLGTVVGNMALSVLAGGGLYLGGGIPPRILERLQQPDFLAAVHDKGRFQALIEAMPVYVILDPKVALHGAAWAGLQASTKPRSKDGEGAPNL